PGGTAREAASNAPSAADSSACVYHVPESPVNGIRAPVGRPGLAEQGLGCAARPTLRRLPGPSPGGCAAEARHCSHGERVEPRVGATKRSRSASWPQVSLILKTAAACRPRAAREVRPAPRSRAVTAATRHGYRTVNRPCRPPAELSPTYPSKPPGSTVNRPWLS